MVPELVRLVDELTVVLLVAGLLTVPEEDVEVAVLRLELVDDRFTVV